MRGFLAGGVAFNTNWNFVWGSMNDSTYSRILGQGGVAPIPAAASTGKAAASVSGFLGLGVLANSAHAELAVEWLRYLTSPEVQAPQTAELPIWTSLQNSAEMRKANPQRSEEHTSELQSRGHLVCRLLLEKKKKKINKRKNKEVKSKKITIKCQSINN